MAPVVRLIPHGYLEALVSRSPAWRPDGIEVPEGTTVGALLEGLGLGGYHVGIVSIDGRVVRADEVLADGAEIQVVPLVGGG